jgi:hypothetical protein
MRIKEFCLDALSRKQNMYGVSNMLTMWRALQRRSRNKAQRGEMMKVPANIFRVPEMT